jgi:thioredoxin
VELDADSFEAHIGRSDIPVVVDFWAPWCGPCRMMAPAYAQAAHQLEPRYRLAKLNTEEAQEIAARFGIRSIPTLVDLPRRPGDRPPIRCHGHRQPGALDHRPSLSSRRPSSTGENAQVLPQLLPLEIPETP